MDKNSPRYLRYKEKFAYITENVKLLEIKPSSELEKKGVYYTIQSIIDAIIDTISMLVKDLGHLVQDDYKNIEILVDQKIFTDQFASTLKKANGMRNVLAHHYNGIIEHRVMNSIFEIKNLAEEAVDKMEEVINDLI